MPLLRKRVVQVLGGVLAAVALAAGAGYGYKTATQPPEYTYRSAKIDRGNIVARVTATGTLSAHVTVLVGCQVSGRIAQLFADFNSPVKKGQVIAKIDPQMFEATLSSARANRFAAAGSVTQAKAQAALAQRNLERAEALRQEGLNTQADLDGARAALDVARAAVEVAKGNFEQARAQEHQAQVNLAYTTIVSPIDGTVISRGVDVGQTVAASLQAPTLFTIAEDLRKMQVDTNITEGDVGKLKDGMSASFLVDAYPNERFRGKIQQIRNAPQTVQNVVTYDAVIDVDNAELKLKPGMTANVTVIYDRREDVLRVSNAALRFRPPPVIAALAPAGSASPASSGFAGHRRRRSPGGGSGDPPDATTRTLWVLRSPLPPSGKSTATPVPVTVRVGLTDGTVTEISGDVNEGDTVVTEATDADEPAPEVTGRRSGPPRMHM